MVIGEGAAPPKFNYRKDVLKKFDPYSEFNLMQQIGPIQQIGPCMDKFAAWTNVALKLRITTSKK